MSKWLKFVKDYIDASNYYDEDLAKIIETAKLNRKNFNLINKFLDKEQKFRSATNSELNDLHNFIIKNLENINLEDLQNKILLIIKSDKEKAEFLNHRLVNAISQDKILDESKEVLSQVKDNKLLEILTGTEEFIKEFKIESIINSDLPAGYNKNLDTVPICGDDGNQTIYGNSRGTYLKTCLLYLKKLIKKQNQTMWDNIDNSTITHVVPISENFMPKEFQDSTFYFTDEKTKHGVVLPNSGYAFGGHYGEERYTNVVKEFAPEDCSSFVTKITGCENRFLTYHQLYSHRRQLNEYGEKGDISDKIINEYNSKFQAVKVSNPQTEIKPGMIYCVRKFNLEDEEKLGNGIGGHTGVVLGLQGNARKLVLGSYNRDMPIKEGIGIEIIEFNPNDPNKKQMFFTG